MLSTKLVVKKEHIIEFGHRLTDYRSYKTGLQIYGNANQSGNKSGIGSLF